MRHLIATILVASACAPAPAQIVPAPAGPPVLTLAEALDRAGLASPSREAADAGRRAAGADRRIAALRPDPSVTLETENVGGTGMYRGVRSAETTAALTWPLERGGKRAARIAFADARIDRAGLDAEIAQADLRLRVVQAYIAAVATRRRLTVATDQVGVAGEALRVADARVRAGRASPLERQRADVVMLAANGALERASRSAQLATTVLARLTGGPVAALDLNWFERPPTGLPDRPLSGTLTAVAARADVATADAAVRLARTGRVPDLTISAGARRLEQTDDIAAIVGVSLPIRVFDTGRAAIEAAAAQRERADALRRAALLDAELAVAGAQADAANAAVTARNATGPALEAAIEAARIARIGYREGKFPQIDLLDAERTLADTRMAAIDALATLHDAQARLDRLTAPANREIRR